MQHVLRLLESRDSVHVSELAEAFAVSEVTVRSDLTSLAQQGLVARVRGGVRRLSAMSLVGDLGTEVLRTTRINKGFLGARGLSLERGLMDLNPDEVRIKQEMADACEQIFGILDGTKWHRSALLSFVPVDELTGIVTDSTAPADDVESWRT